MRKRILIVLLVAGMSVSAQTTLPLSFMDYLYPGSFRTNPLSLSTNTAKKWFWTSYTGVSTSFAFFNGGNASIVSVPVGLQLNRKINENLYAFAGVSAAPAYMHFNSSALASSSFYKSYQGNGVFKSNSFGAYTRAEMGLMYVNDAKTFSISGSIGVERRNYPLLPYRESNVYPANHAVAPNR